MVHERVEVFVEALRACDESVWQQTRYANNTGTCLWCSGGALVMVPDDPDGEWFCQAKGAEALTARLTPIVNAAFERLAAAAPTDTASTFDAHTPATRALLAAVEAVRHEARIDAEAAALDRVRGIFSQIVASKFGLVPPHVQQRIDAAGFDDLERWGRRIFTAPNAMLVVV